MKGIDTETTGRRIYITGNTFNIKDEIKRIGGKWDADRRAWWVGTARAAEVERLLAADELPPEKPDDVVVTGKARYKGRSYFVRGAGTDKTNGNTRLRLTSLDAKVDFWATLGNGPDEAAWERRYETVTTLGKLRRFVERQKSPATRRSRCTECDAWGPCGETCDECREGTHV